MEASLGQLRNSPQVSQHKTKLGDQVCLGVPCDNDMLDVLNTNPGDLQDAADCKPWKPCKMCFSIKTFFGDRGNQPAIRDKCCRRVGVK